MKEPITITNQRYRLGYHVMTPGGWMNDPNGFSFFKGWYHIFYQYYPYAAEWGPMHWGHARSRDLVHWETLPVALAPDENENGCFSGSAVVYDDKLWLIYTGHHTPNAVDPEDFYQDQRVAWSEDGIHFTKYGANPVLRTPAGNTKHFRDPKVWQEGDMFYMVLGSQDVDGLGRALVYSSPDLLHWQLDTELCKSVGKEQEGYMWECPDFFHLDGKDILLMSPQGLEADGDRFRNLNQTGYLLGNVEDKKLQHAGFVEIDNGHDFYATQTMLTPDGRRVMIAWMNAWDSPMPEIEDGWAGALTLPRELSVKDGRLLQKPVRELTGLRQEVLLNGCLEAERDYKLGRQAELELTFTEKAEGVLLLLSDGDKSLQLSLEPGGRFVLNRNTKDGERAAVLTSKEPLKLQIFIDKSSAELFVADGELTFTERIYWEKDVNCRLLAKAANQVKAWRLEGECNQY